MLPFGLRGKGRAFARLLILGIALVVAGKLQAGPISGNGTLGDYTGSLTYLATDANNASLTITLNNTSAAANGGFLTAFVFNNPGNLITGATLDGDNTFTAFELVFGNNVNSANPFGDFDFIVSATKKEFEGGGNPTGGITPGASATFTLALTGTSLNTFTATSFESALSNNPGGGGAQYFVARFRGFEDGGSDKVPGQPGGDPIPHMPVPPSLILMGVGGMGLALARWRSRRQAAA